MKQSLDVGGLPTLCGQQVSPSILVGMLSLAMTRPIHSAPLASVSLAGVMSPTMTPRGVSPKLEMKVPRGSAKTCHPDETQRYADLQTNRVLFFHESIKKHTNLRVSFHHGSVAAMSLPSVTQERGRTAAISTHYRVALFWCSTDRIPWICCPCVYTRLGFRFDIARWI